MACERYHDFGGKRRPTRVNVAEDGSSEHPNAPPIFPDMGGVRGVVGVWRGVFLGLSVTY